MNSIKDLKYMLKSILLLRNSTCLWDGMRIKIQKENTTENISMMNLKMSKTFSQKLLLLIHLSLSEVKQEV
jgi:hypothetical protein